MIWPFFLLLLLAGVFAAYRFSPASRARRQVINALLPLEKLRQELWDQAQSIQSAIREAANEYVQVVQAARLRAIPLDELKKHGTGMRLQALKDFGVTTLADLQGWDEYRISQVHGVGPKSASMIAVIARQLTNTTKSVPVHHPVPPFDITAEWVLIKAIYIQRLFEQDVTPLRDKFEKCLLPLQDARDEILDHTNFKSWVWTLGKGNSVQSRVQQAKNVCEEIDGAAFQDVHNKAATALSELERIRANQLENDLLIQDFNANKAFYESLLTAQLGAPKQALSAPPKDQVHVEFNRLVAGPPGPTPTSNASSEKLHSVVVGHAVTTETNEFTIPMPPPRVVELNYRWYGRGEKVSIQGFDLNHGFLYVGKSNTENGSFVVDPQLPVLRGDVTQTDVWIDRDNYQTLTKELRGRYLLWLANGASSMSEDCFGMLYFYGLEHRLIDLIQGKVTDSSPEEIALLREEVFRIARLYSNSAGNVSQACYRLSDFVSFHSLDGALPDLPPAHLRSYELPLTMRYGLGCFIRDCKPISLEWALRWAELEPTIYFRTPATRCPNEFAAAFAAIYKEKFEEGIVIPANKTPLKITYTPWLARYTPGSKAIKLNTKGIPDIAALNAPLQTLREIVDKSTAAIDPYSRFLGRSPEKAGTLEAYLNLPVEFWPADAKSRLDELKSGFAESLEPIQYDAFLQKLGVIGDPATLKITITEIADSLKRAAIGIEPDVLLGGRRPRSGDAIVLFPLSSATDSDRASNNYKRASLTVSLSACVALADGHASADEANAVDAMIASWQHLDKDQQMRLRAQYRLQVRQAISLTNLKSRFAGMSSEGRMQMAMALSSLASADGTIDAREVKLLEQVYRALEIDTQLLYSHLHGRRSSATQSRVRESSTGTVAKFSFAVDTKRLEDLRKETEQVGELLAGVFVEEEPTVETKNVVSSVTANEAATGYFPLPGLDKAHQEFLRELLQRPSWPRSELEAVAAKLRIMLDGALERINDAAFDMIGEALTDGDDPIYVQQHILENA